MDTRYISCPKCNSSDISIITCKCMMCFDYMCDSCQNEFDRRQFLNKQNAIKNIIEKLNTAFGVNDYVFLPYYVEAIRRGTGRNTRSGFESRYNLENLSKSNSESVFYYPEDNNSIHGSRGVSLGLLVEMADFF